MQLQPGITRRTFLLFFSFLALAEIFAIKASMTGSQNIQSGSISAYSCGAAGGAIAAEIQVKGGKKRVKRKKAKEITVADSEEFFQIKPICLPFHVMETSFQRPLELASPS